MIDVQKIRNDFPLLHTTMRGKPVVYLDSGATSLKPQSVLDAEAGYYRELGANIHRAVYEKSEEATTQFECTRHKTAMHLNAKHAHEVIFTKSATESVNLVAYTWGRQEIGEGDEILLTELEHHANLIPWQVLANETGARLRFIPIDADAGTLLLDDIDTLINENTKLVALTAMSNVTGIRTPVQAIVEKAHAKGARTLIDAAQSIAHEAVDVQALDCDFLVFSAHKMLGPTGVGVLYGKEELLERMPPFLYGGDMILQVWKEKATYNELPYKFEGGTPNIAGVIAFGESLAYLNAIGMDAIAAHEKDLLEYAFKKAEAVEDFFIFGSKDTSMRGGIISFAIGDVHPHDTGGLLDRAGIAVRTGHHCCQPLMRVWGIPGTTRASFYLYNTKEEIDALFDALAKVREVFGGF